MIAYGPSDGKDESTNTFHRLAKMACAVGNECRIYIVAADHAALHVKGMERYDESLGGFHPLYPHPQTKKREQVTLWHLIPLPTGARWIVDDEDPNHRRWRSKDGGLHDMDDAMDCCSDGEWEDIEERDREASGVPAAKSLYVCYDQKGRIVSSPKRYPPERHQIAREHLSWARALISKRIAVMETLVHQWIDHILDSRLPTKHSRKYEKTRDEINKVKKLKYASIQFISTYEYHQMEGNNDEMDSPAEYL